MNQSFGHAFDGTKANYCDRNCGLVAWQDPQMDDRYAVTALGGSYPPHSYGLYDMSGNVWE
jgi:formylglycine-generating enzyme required for sulfatase activity